MKEFESGLNLVAPSSIVEYAEDKAYAQNLILKEKPSLKFNTQEELLYYITHKVNNVKNKNGRIYLKIDESGKLYANSISPYAETYLDNIEPNIKPLVEGFYKKRYLTYSSCEGHGLSFRRYVGLAFADEESRDYVADKVMGLKLPGVFVKKMSSVSNQILEQDSKGYPIFVDKLTEESKKLELEKIRKSEAISFNIQFHRKYESYLFLEIVILEEIPFNATGVKWFFKKIWLGTLKKYFWNKITNKIVKLVNSDDFKKYKY